MTLNKNEIKKQTNNFYLYVIQLQEFWAKNLREKWVYRNIKLNQLIITIHGIFSSSSSSLSFIFLTLLNG